MRGRDEYGDIEDRCFKENGVAFKVKVKIWYACHRQGCYEEGKGKMEERKEEKDINNMKSFWKKAIGKHYFTN